MSEKRWPPNDPREWINRAFSNLAQAETGIRLPAIYLEDLCFQAQQAAEKALKAVLIAHKVQIPRSHDLAELLTVLEQVGLVPPPTVYDAVQLTVYAVSARYPGIGEPVTEDEYDMAVGLATKVVLWARTEVYGELEGVKDME